MVVELHFSLQAAYELQHLDLADCKADYAVRRAAGQGAGAIVQAWRVAPPPSTTAAPWSSIAGGSDAGPAAGIAIDSDEAGVPGAAGAPAAPTLDGDDDASWQLPASGAARWRALLAARLEAAHE